VEKIKRNEVNVQDTIFLRPINAALEKLPDLPFPERVQKAKSLLKEVKDEYEKQKAREQLRLELIEERKQERLRHE
jgi:hypothetical protein